MKTQPTKTTDVWRELAPPPARPPADFWAEFQARASLVPQARPRHPAYLRTGWLYAAGAVAAMALAVLAVSRLLTDPASPGTSLAKLPVGASAPLSRIEEVQVFVDNASVMVFEDKENGGTVVFVEASPLPNHT